MAPAWAASSGEPSSEPLSTTMTSPALPERSSQLRALRTHTSTVSFSLRQGMTIEMNGYWEVCSGSSLGASVVIILANRNRPPELRLVSNGPEADGRSGLDDNFGNHLRLAQRVWSLGVRRVI